jgi:ABC-type Na+ efflux pump permease subunit
VNLRKLLRIARWEVTKNAGGLDRRTVAVVVVAVVGLGLVAPVVGTGSVGVDDGIYRVAVDEDSQYYDVVANDPTFTVREASSRDALERGTVDLWIDGRGVEPADSRKGAAAYEELRESVNAYNNQELAKEANQTAAFPVSVTVQFRDQAAPDTSLGAGDGTGDDSPDSDPDEDTTDTGSDGSDGGSPGTGGDDTGSTGDDSISGGDAGGPAPGGITGPLSEDELSGSPADINPPFPFQSLVLAFIFVIPLNFLIQAYGSTMLSERLKRRGELLLVSPVTRLDIIGGKTLPYFAGAMAAEGAIAVGLVYVARGELGGLISMLAIMPLVLLFLGATFLGSMFARSFKELTFVTVTITVVLTSYAFVPAIFTDVDSLALISPLTLVVRDLQGEAIGLQGFVFSTLPPLLSALVFFGLGSGLYREEDMFDQRSISGKVLDALAGPISRPYHVGVMTIILIPFVFVIQLLAIAMLFATGEISIPLILVVVAVVEEIAKSLHIYAAYDHNRFDATAKVAIALGIASGIGFFLGEKIALLAQLVGLQNLAVAEAGLSGGVADVSGPVVILFLLAPLVLHTVTAAISALGARKDRRSYLLALAVAIAVHFLYNFAVVRSFV